MKKSALLVNKSTNTNSNRSDSLEKIPNDEYLSSSLFMYSDVSGPKRKMTT